MKKLVISILLLVSTIVLAPVIVEGAGKELRITYATAQHPNVPNSYHVSLNNPFPYAVFCNIRTNTYREYSFMVSANSWSTPVLIHGNSTKFVYECVPFI